MPVFHAKSAGRDHQMHRVAGKKHATPAVAFGQEKVLLPFPDIEHLVIQRCSHNLFKLLRHGLIAVHDGMKGPMARRILHDQEGLGRIGHMIVPPVSGTWPHGQAVEQVITAVECLPHARDVTLTRQSDAEGVTHRAATTIATDEIVRMHGFQLISLRPHPCGHAIRGLGRAPQSRNHRPPEPLAELRQPP